jgi:hypothetical protein
MSSIFISYATEDRGRARLLAHALEQRGWSVWWDREIPLGKAFDEVIEENLTHAQCVLVLWSKASVESRWVRAEASAAAARNVLVPVLLERELTIPLQFRMLHAADLSDWEGDTQHSEFGSLTTHIETMLGAGTEARIDSMPERVTPVVAAATDAQTKETAAGATATKQSRRHQGVRHALTFVLLPTVLIGAVTSLLMNWRVPTEVQVDLIVDRATFTIAGGESVEIPERPLKFRSLTIENFDWVRLTPERFVLDAGDDRIAAGNVGPGDELALEGVTDSRPVLTVTSAETETGATGQLEQMALGPQSELILAISNEAEPSFTARVFGQKLEVNVLPASVMGDEFSTPVLLDLSTKDATLAGISGTTGTADIALREVTLAPYAPYVAIKGERQDFAVTATLDGTETVQLGVRVPVSEVEFLRQDAGQSRTALVASGKLVYPGYPDIAAVVLESDDFIEVDELKEATLSRLMLDPDRGRMELQLEGKVGRLVVNAKTDHRLTLFDRLWHGPRMTVLFAILAWAFSVSMGAYKLYRDVTGSR